MWFLCVFFYISVLPHCEKKKCLMRIKSTKSTKNVFASNSYSRTRQMPRSPLRQHPLTMEERYQSTVAAAGGDDNGRRHLEGNVSKNPKNVEWRIYWSDFHFRYSWGDYWILFMPHNGFKTKKYKEQWQLVLSKRDLLVTTPNPGGKNPKKMWQGNSKGHNFTRLLPILEISCK